MRIYRLLLLLYPACFRNEYGGQLRTAFADGRRQTTGAIGVATFWVDVLLDTLANAARTHWDILWQDLRYAVRTLARSPGFTLTAIAVAALGIGATTAAFTMIDHVLICGLPFPDASRLVNLYEDHRVSNGGFWDASPATYRDWKQMSTSFERMGAYHNVSLNLAGEGDPQRLEAADVTADLFPTLGVAPLLGRTFAPEDDRDGAAGTVVLSYSLWQEVFGGDAGVLGRKVLLDNLPHTVIGVMPNRFYFPTREAQLWRAIRFSPDAFGDRLDTYIYGVAKLRPGVSVKQAQAEMGTIGGRLSRAYPKEMGQTGAAIIPLGDDFSDRSKVMLKTLAGAAFCVLLIACTNLANLLLARAMSRRRELAVRFSLGGGRERLLRQMLTESVLVALAGGAAGVVLARSALPLLARLVPTGLPIAEVPVVDVRILLFATLLTCATALAFGAAPALYACRRVAAEGLREGARSGVGGRRSWQRSTLVVAQVAGSVVLLVACGLLARALWRVQSVNPGFRSDHALTLRTTLPMPKYEQRSAREAFYARVLADARALPGVTGAAYVSFLPMTLRGGIWPVEVAGHPEDPGSRRTASLRFVTPGFFAAMEIPLRMGRDVRESDGFTSAWVAVVSESFARQFWPGENAIGRHFDFGNGDRTVVGVVGDVRVRGLERRSEPQVYLSYRQQEKVALFYAPKDMVVRCSGQPEALAPALRAIVRGADAQQPVSDVRPLADIVGNDVAPRSVQVRALGLFAAIALLLAGVGIHGLLSFAVSSRRQEIGVRMALGARAGDLVRMMLGQGVRLAAIGLALGVPLAYVAGRLLESLLAGIQPGDVATFATATMAAVAASAAGSLIPAVRAARVDPAITIRAE